MNNPDIGLPNSSKIYAFQCTFCFEKFEISQNLEQRLLGHYYGQHGNDKNKQISSTTQPKIEKSNELLDEFLEIQIKKEDSVEFVNCSGSNVKLEPGLSQVEKTNLECEEKDIEIEKKGCLNVELTDCRQTTSFQIQQSKNFQCYLCRKRFSSCEKLKKHRITHGRGRSSKSYKMKLKVHISGEYKCEFCCDGMVYSLKDFESHRRQHATLLCDICPKKFCKLEELDLHKVEHWTGNLPEFRCNLCLRTFLSQTRLVNHMKTHRDIKTKDAKLFSYNCKICEAVFESNVKCIAHEWNHVFNIEELKKNGSPFPCQYCNEFLPDIQKLKYHYTKIHDPNKSAGHICPECGKVLNSKNYLELHVKTHQDAKEYQCDICKEMFKNKMTIKQHLLLHTQNGVPKKYRCNSCPAKFTSHRGLEYHRLSHTGERNYPCTVCSSTFKNNAHLKHHMQIHTGERDFHCKPCGKAYTSNTSRKKHNLSVHGIAKSTIPLNKEETVSEAND